MPKNTCLDIRPVSEADGPVSVLARAIEAAPGGVDDLIEALRQGATIYEAEDTYLVPLSALMTARRLKEIQAESVATMQPVHE